MKCFTHDDSKYFRNVGEYPLNSTGNFIGLLNFRYRDGDVDVINHFKDFIKNASYIPKTTQNDLINCCGEIIFDQILFEVKKNKNRKRTTEERRTVLI